ncbi:MAG: polysaccharide deacetylase family protein [Candidatus Tectomicrobia bacterium]|uniref:Polysaccharide deacetylase family protein n=1 Tax=Tectimicrobiota bacterium TaxID=2528274 RepID=A0A932GPI7_UNCTE|nr:polysaccharide deacetylase family protein [Candidatus Tectomicrobia bacterium]
MNARRNHAGWPDGARIAVSLVLNIEEWSREEAAPYMNPIPADAVTRRDFPTITDREYGYRAGLWRLLDVLEQREVKATAVVSGLAAERHPEVIKEIYDRGHEVAAHSYDQSVSLVSMNDEEEEEAIRRSVAAIEKATGQKPQGWLSPGCRCTDRTLRLLAQYGFTWHGDFLNDDLPYLVTAGNGELVEIPYSLILNDYRLFLQSNKTPQEVVDVLTYEFDHLYEEGESNPMLMTVGIHPHVTGRPGRAGALAQFLDYARSHDRVWFARRREIAEWWLSHSGKE